MILRKVVAGSPWFFRVNVMFMVWFVCLFITLQHTVSHNIILVFFFSIYPMYVLQINDIP